MPKSPPPNTYIIKGLFEATAQRKGTQFGESRQVELCSIQNMMSTGPLSTIKLNKNPGPGAYELRSTLSKSTYSFNAGTNLENKEQAMVPGPGKCTFATKLDDA